MSVRPLVTAHSLLNARQSPGKHAVRTGFVGNRRRALVPVVIAPKLWPSGASTSTWVPRRRPGGRSSCGRRRRELVPVIGLSGDDPCGKTQLTKRLSALKTNLTTAITAIKQAYPGTRMAITKYFNPLPIEAEVCPLMEALYYYKTVVVDHKGGDVAIAFAKGELDSKISTFQSDVVLRALSVIGKLNSVIGQVADAQGATWPMTFSTHDLCKDYPDTGHVAWVFGPEARAFASFYNNVVGTSREVDLVPVHRCQPLPACDGDRQYRVDNFYSKKVLGTTYSLSVSFRLNDLPHPTSDGHDAVAGIIKDRLQM